MNLQDLLTALHSQRKLATKPTSEHDHMQAATKQVLLGELFELHDQAFSLQGSVLMALCQRLVELGADNRGIATRMPEDQRDCWWWLDEEKQEFCYGYSQVYTPHEWFNSDRFDSDSDKPVQFLSNNLVMILSEGAGLHLFDAAKRIEKPCR